MHNKKIQEQIDCSIDKQKYQKFTGSVGTIISYDKFDNTATVAISKTETDEVSDFLKKVPCPTNIGIQTVAPSPGTMVYVVFRNGILSQPLITHFWNHQYSKYDYSRQTHSVNNIPTYLLG